MGQERFEDNFQRARQQLGVAAERQKRNYTVEAQDDEPETYTYRSRTLRNRRLPGRFADYYMG